MSVIRATERNVTQSPLILLCQLTAPESVYYMSVLQPPSLRLLGRDALHVVLALTTPNGVRHAQH